MSTQTLFSVTGMSKRWVMNCTFLSHVHQYSNLSSVIFTQVKYSICKHVWTLGWDNSKHCSFRNIALTRLDAAPE